MENSTKDGLIKRTTSMLRTVLEDLESPHSVLQAESSASTHNPSRFCQHYLNVLVHYISYYSFVRLTWLNLSTQSNITSLFFFFFTLNIVK